MIQALQLLRAAAVVPLLVASAAGEGRSQAPAADAPPQLTPAAIKAYRELARIRAAPTVSVEAESRRLFEFGSGVVQPLVGVLETGIVPRVDGDVPQPAQAEERNLTSQQEDVVLAALVQFGRKPLVQPLTRELAQAPTVRFRADCLRLLKSVGDREDLRLICQVVAPAEATGDVDPALAPVFVEAATSILSRDFAALFAVGDLWREIPSATRLCLYRALGEVASPLSVSTLSLRLGRQPAEDPFVLTELARASKKVPLPADTSVLELVRPYLRSEQSVLVQSAATCLGGCQDDECIVDLLRLLSDPDAGVRAAAHQALCSIAGLGLWPDVSRWTSWYEAERAWFADVAPGRIQDIRSGTVAEQARAIADLAEHPLYRKEIGLELQNLLPHATDTMRLLGVRALGQLGAATAVPYLESCALGGDRDLAGEARAALGRIQGQRERPAAGVP